MKPWSYLSWTWNCRSSLSTPKSRTIPSSLAPDRSTSRPVTVATTLYRCPWGFLHLDSWLGTLCPASNSTCRVTKVGNVLVLLFRGGGNRVEGVQVPSGSSVSRWAPQSHCPLARPQVSEWTSTPSLV